MWRRREAALAVSETSSDPSKAWDYNPRNLKVHIEPCVHVGATFHIINQNGDWNRFGVRGYAHTKALSEVKRKAIEYVAEYNRFLDLQEQLAGES